LAAAPDGSWLASASWDATVRVWDTRSGEARYVFAGHTDRVKALAADPGARWLASTSEDQTLRIWDSRTGGCAAALRTGHALRHVVTDGRRLVLAGDIGAYLLTT
jgi:WD40 repeat protein